MTNPRDHGATILGNVPKLHPLVRHQRFETGCLHSAALYEEGRTPVVPLDDFGTLAMFLYPALHQLNLDLHLFATAQREFGLFAGSTIHEVAQVLAAGNAVGENAANIAVITKMVRVMMLAPFLIGTIGLASARGTS